MEVDEDGVLAKIVKSAESGSIKVGEVIAVVAEDGEDWSEVAKTGVTGETSSGHETAPAGQDPVVSSGGNTPGTVINMPSLSPTMSEGSIVKWYKQEGENISAGDVLCDIQTDKAVVSMESDEDGVVAKILVSEGAAGVSVGTPICLMVEEGQDWRDVTIPAPTQSSSQPAAPEPQAAPAVTTQATPAVTPSAAPAAAAVSYTHPAQTGPATALLLTQFNIDPAAVEASGPKGNLTKADVLKYIKDKALPTPAAPAVPLPPAAAPQTPAAVSEGETPAYVDIELTNMRKVIAKRLTESKQLSPHGYCSATSNITNLNKLRQDYIKSGFKISVNDFVIAAVAGALQYVPQLNANVVNEEPQYMQNIDISVAVATPNGLITPIVKNANLKTVQEISADVKDLAAKARENKLKLDEFQGGTFTISNLGMFGITEFTAIINSPQLAILAVGGGTTGR